MTEPEATFSTCFGAPFMPRHPSVYGNLLKERIAKGGVDCWLVNTGWTGGKYGVGKRMPIKATRALLNAALDGSLNDAEFRNDPNFGFEVPVAVPGVDSAILDPRGTWADKADYDRTAAKLVDLFIENFAQVRGACRRRRPPSRAARLPPPLNLPGHQIPGSHHSKDPINDRIFTAPFHALTPRSRISAKVFLPAPCRARNGPTRRISAPRPILCCTEPDIDLDAELPGIIRRFNESVGGVNSDTQGYHETITRTYVAGVRLFLSETDETVWPNASTRCCFRTWAAATGRCASKSRAAVLGAGAARISRHPTLPRCLSKYRAFRCVSPFCPPYRHRRSWRARRAGRCRP